MTPTSRSLSMGPALAGAAYWAGIAARNEGSRPSAAKPLSTYKVEPCCDDAEHGMLWLFGAGQLLATSPPATEDELRKWRDKLEAGEIKPHQIDSGK